MLDQILETVTRHAEKTGYQLNEKALEQIRANAKSYDRLVNDRHYTMKTEINDENTCVVQFATEEGKVISTYTFFNMVIVPAKK